MAVSEQLEALDESEGSWADYAKGLAQAGFDISPAGDIQQIKDGVPQIVDDLSAIGNVFVDETKRVLNPRTRLGRISSKV